MVTIRPYRQSDSLEELTALLHRAYAPLAQMGFKYFASHQTVDQTRRRIAGGSCCVAEQDGALVGTITWYRQDRNTKAPPLYREPDVAHFAQFGVEPALQRQAIGARLISHIESAARDAGCYTMALDTAEDATHLVAWYHRLGYRAIGYTQWEVTNYRSVMMSKGLLPRAEAVDKSR
jgi:GNAT superfamily N-acetyltransferase